MYVSKKMVFLLALILGTAVLVFGFHVIRVDDGIEIVRKEKITYRDFYVDVRGYSLADYFYHAPKIRNYLFFERPYNRLLHLIERKKTELENPDKGEPAPEGTVAKTLKPVERAIRDWIDKVVE